MEVTRVDQSSEDFTTISAVLPAIMDLKPASSRGMLLNNNCFKFLVYTLFSSGDMTCLIGATD